MSKDNTIFIGKTKSFWDRNRRSNGYLLKRRVSEIAVSVIRALLMFGLCFMIIQPLLTRFGMSLMQEKDLYDSTVVLLPRHVTLANYKIVADLTDFPNSMINTLWISIVVSICQVVACTIVGYGFGRFEFPLKKFWFACVIAVIIIPPQIISSSLYTTFARFDFFGLITLLTGSTINLRASIWPYIMMSLTCMGLKNGLYIFMLRQYFKNVPDSLEEAAYVDGCGTFHTFFRIMLPLTKTAMIALAVFTAVFAYSDMMWPLIVNNNINMMTLSAGISSMQGQYTTRYPILMAGSTLAMIPMMVLYLLFQRQFIEGIALTGTKG